MNFEELDVTQLDKDLSEDQKREWEAIYASYRSKSILTGKVIGVDTVKAPIFNPETGRHEARVCNCLVLLDYRVRVLIPETEIWFSPDKRPGYVLRSMVGSTVDYVIAMINREEEWCMASRCQAMLIRRRSFVRIPPRIGERVELSIMAVGRTHLFGSVGGFDVSLSQKDLTYAMVQDLRDRFRPGETRAAIFKGFDKEQKRISVSVKEAEPHPFIGADKRHPVGCRRASKIVGKYKGGVFCSLGGDLICLCTYSQYQSDEDFEIGDDVIVVVTRYNYEKQQVYGKIVAKW